MLIDGLKNRHPLRVQIDHQQKTALATAPIVTGLINFSAQAMRVS